MGPSGKERIEWVTFGFPFGGWRASCTLAAAGFGVMLSGALAGAERSFQIVPLETVSETSSDASIGDINGDGHPDIVLVKGRHWQVTTRTRRSKATPGRSPT